MENLIPLEKIQNKILLIRGEKVMLDRDLAYFYGVDTRSLLQAVKSKKVRAFTRIIFRRTININGGGILGITKCDTIKEQYGRKNALCLYRTGHGHAFFGIE